MTLKELALTLTTIKKIVIVENNEEGILQDTKVFDDSKQLFLDSLYNVLWKADFYNRKVWWITDSKENEETVIKVRIL